MANKFERKVDFTICIKPSLKERVKKVHKELGFRSASALVVRAIRELLERMGKGEGDG